MYRSATADTLDDDDAAVAEDAAFASLAVDPPEGALARAADPPLPPLDEKYLSKGSFGFFWSFGFFFAVAPVALFDDDLAGATLLVLLVLLATDTELGSYSGAL